MYKTALKNGHFDHHPILSRPSAPSSSSTTSMQKLVDDAKRNLALLDKDVLLRALDGLEEDTPGVRDIVRNIATMARRLNSSSHGLQRGPLEFGMVEKKVVAMDRQRARKKTKKHPRPHDFRDRGQQQQTKEA